MARKNPPKPLFELRLDFMDSLENVCQQSLMLLQAIDTLILHGDLKPGLKDLLVKRSKAMRAALMPD